MNLFTILTVREISEWWGYPHSTVARHVLQSYEEGNDAIRRSGKTLLINSTWAFERYGAPQKERPKYD